AGEKNCKKPNTKNSLPKERGPGANKPRDHRTFVEITNVVMARPKPVVCFVSDYLQIRAISQVECCSNADQKQRALKIESSGRSIRHRRRAQVAWRIGFYVGGTHTQD